MQVIDNSTNNIATFNGENKFNNSKVIFQGNNNVFECNDVKLNNCSIKFSGSNSKVVLHTGVRILGNLLLVSECKIEIFDYTHSNAAIRLHCGERGTLISIGKNCLLANVRIHTSDQHEIYDLDTNERLNYADDVIINDNVWLAEDTYIYKGVKIGEGSIVGSRSTVTNSLPSKSLSVGSPAKVVKNNIGWHDKIRKPGKKKGQVSILN